MNSSIEVEGSHIETQMVVHQTFTTNKFLPELLVRVVTFNLDILQKEKLGGCKLQRNVEASISSPK